LKKRQGFAAKVRKINGQCYNQLLVESKGALFQRNLAECVNNTRFYRWLTGWRCTKQWFTNLLCSHMTGPSTTAGTDLNLNKHLWMQGVTSRIRIINPTAQPIRVTIYKMQLKCQERAPVPPTYVDATGVWTGVADNDPWHLNWDFFSQDSRSGPPAGVQHARNVQQDRCLARNIGGVYDGCPVVGSNLFEVASTTLRDFQTELDRMDFQFPTLKRKLRKSVIFSGVIPPGQVRVAKYTLPFPREIRPRETLDTSQPFFYKESHALFIDAIPAPVTSMAGAVMDGNVLTNWTQLVDPKLRIPPQLTFHETIKIKFRMQGDSLPSYEWVDFNDMFGGIVGGMASGIFPQPTAWNTPGTITPAVYYQYNGPPDSKDAVPNRSGGGMIQTGSVLQFETSGN